MEIYDRLHIYITRLKEIIKEQERLREQPDYDMRKNTIVSCFVVTDDNTFGRIDDIYSLMHHSEVEIDYGLSKREVRSLLENNLKYAIGIANLITANIDPYPQNPKRDVRIIPYNPDKKNRLGKQNNHSVIRVFGKLRKDLDNFNNEIKKSGRYNIDAIIVRGHWRHFRSDRFKNKQGETIWIMPFVRGKDRELLSRVIEVKE
jgi:hypothetical protein